MRVIVLFNVYEHLSRIVFIDLNAERQNRLVRDPPAAVRVVWILPSIQYSSQESVLNTRSQMQE